MRFLIWARRKEKRICPLVVKSIAEEQSPKPVYRERVTVICTQLSPEISACDIKRINAAISEVADEQGVAESAEICRCYRKTPGGVQLAAPGKTFQKTTIRIKDVNETESSARYIVMLRVILFCIRHIDTAVKVLNAERPKIGLHFRVGK